MSVNILTPVTIWKDFSISHTINSTFISEVSEDDIITKRFFIDGRNTENGQVKIFCTIKQKESVKNAPAVLMIKEFNDDSIDASLNQIANEGYIACTVDIEGKVDGVKNFTIYPEDINYANYNISKDTIYKITNTAKETCWYEWATVIKYAISFLKNNLKIDKIGVIGAGENVTALWQAVAFNEEVSAFVPVYNIGWKSYKGHYKFDNEPEIIFPDEELMLVAGIEPQSYASYVKCPTFAVCNSNDILFESDRAHDTIKRVDNDIKGIYYDKSVLHGLTNESVKTIKIFLDEILKGEKAVDFIEPLISSKKSNGEIIITVETFNEIENLTLFASEEQIKTEFRSYIAYTNYKRKENLYIFKYTPFYKSKRVHFFATALLQNGGLISTNIESVEFETNEVKQEFQKQILYSSRESGGENIFLSKEKIKFNEIFEKKKEILSIKNGPQGIKGLSMKNGIISFAIKSLKYKPNFDSILMLDLFSKEKANVFVKVYTSYFENRKEYFFHLSLDTSKAWINNKIDFSKFKTEEGMSLKENDEIDAIEFSCDKEVLINNILWI